MPTAKRSGVTSAISTGRAPRRLSFLRKPAPLRNQAEQPPVDRRETERDQPKADEVLRRQRLIEKQRPENDRDRRHQQRDEQRVGSSRGRDEPEIEHIAERGAE